MDKKETKLGLTAKKENFSEWFSQICSESGAQLADIRYGVQGCVVHRPWAMKILKKIYSEFEREVEADNHEPYLFPTMIPEENLVKEKEHAGFTPEVFWVETAGSQKLERRLALRPTGETQIYPMYSLWIQSHKDLPWKGYQSRITVFRNEMTTRPFLRGREFMFFETHDVFAAHNEALKQIETDMQIMDRVVKKKLKIPFVFFKRPKWDKFKGADDTFASDSLNPDGRRNQISSTHDLGQNFAKAFSIKFDAENGNKEFGFQTCFGPGIWRIMAALIATHGDDNGLILPVDFAPIQVAIVPITFANNPKSNMAVMKLCEEARQIVAKTNLKAHIDTRDESPGYKFNDWELKGVPLRIEIGPKDVEKSQVVIARRTDRKKTFAPIKELARLVVEQAIEVDKEISRRAEESFKDNTRTASTLEEAKKLLKEYKGFVKTPWCSTEMDGQKCADIMSDETQGGVVCGTPNGREEKPEGNCIICNKPAKHTVYLAKSI